MNWTKVKEYGFSTKNERRWILNLPGAGCNWAKQSDGCLMCNFKAATDKITFGKLLPPHIFLALYGIAYLAVKKNKPDSIVIYNGGSFLNDKEIPVSAQEKIFSKISKDKNIRKVIIESRPEFVKEQKLNFLKKILSKKELVIGIGLETKSDSIREKSINKGFSRRHFERAVVAIENSGAQLLTYVLLKPPYLSEKSAINEAIETIEYAFKVGSVEVDLESTSVVEGTIVEELYHKGEYEPPWLWSILEVVKQTYHLGSLNIGSFDDYPPPIVTPKNCSKCTNEIIETLEQFNKNQNIYSLNNIQCDCKRHWQEIINN